MNPQSAITRIRMVTIRILIPYPSFRLRDFTLGSYSLGSDSPRVYTWWDYPSIKKRGAASDPISRYRRRSDIGHVALREVVKGRMEISSSFIFREFAIMH